tara:strand:- start:1629 stop:3608 length:1980 start_codon:yes stop_codon:yes gene_type:complete
MPKTPDFTTNIQETEPRLTYTTPKGLDAKYNNLSGVLETADSVINDVIAYDQQRVISQAEEIATQTASDYLKSSPSNTAYNIKEHQRLRTNLALDPTNEKASKWKESLDKITNKLSNVYNQSDMTSYEFERRSNALIMDLINRNPAYRDEIVSETTKVYNTMGLTDVLAQDAKLQKSTDDAFKAEDDAYNKIILDSHQNPFDMSFMEKKLEVTRLQKEDYDEAELETIAKMEGFLDEKDKIEFENRVEQFTYRNKSGIILTGYDAVTEKTFAKLSRDTLEVIDDPLVPGPDKLFRVNTILNTTRQRINYIGRNFSKDNKDKVTRWYDEQIKQIDILAKLYENDLLGTNTKTWLQNLDDGASLTNKLALREQGLNIEAIKLATDVRNLIIESTRLDRNYKPTVPQLDAIIKGINSIEAFSGVKMPSNATNEGLTMFYAQGAPSKLRKLENFFNTAEDKDLELDGLALGFMNNLFTNSENLEVQESSTARMKYDDKILTAISGYKDKTIKYLLNNDELKDFKNSFSNELIYYKNTVAATIIQQKKLQNIKDSDKIPVDYLSGMGIFNVPGNKELNNEMQRVNKYIQARAKFEGVKPNTIAEEILAKDFPMFTLGTKSGLPEPTSDKVKETTDLPPLTSEDVNKDTNDIIDSNITFELIEAN